MTIELARFLLARVSDDEAEAHRRLRTAVNPSDRDRLERILVEAGAKRDIIGMMQRLAVLRDLPGEEKVRELALEVLRVYAQIYRDHPSFRPIWLIAANA